MHTLTSHNPTHFPLCAKAIVNISLACITTFTLFVLMAKLIEQDEVSLTVLQPPYIPTVIQQEYDEKTIFKPTVKPMPKTVKAPTTPPPEQIAASEPNNQFAIGPIVPKSELIVDTHVGQGNTNHLARPVIRIDPNYPADAARDGIEGWVTLSFDLTPQGSVTNINVIEAQPKRTFNREAKRALAKWKYQPKLENGVPVAQSGLQVMLTFALEQ